MAETALNVSECARRLQVSERTLQRYLDAGAPQIRPGRRGRGNTALLDPDAIAAWVATRSGAANAEALLRALAADIPGIVAEQLHRQFCDTSGPHKLAVGREFPILWGRLTEALLERVRRDVPDIRNATAVPDDIVKIAHACRI